MGRKRKGKGGEEREEREERRGDGRPRIFKLATGLESVFLSTEAHARK